MPNSTILDEIFKTKEEDVETFSEAFRSNITENETVQLKKTASLVTETQKFITIVHGTHETNYVWHIRPSNPKRPWAVKMDRVLFAIGKVLSEYIPNDVMIDLHLPDRRWQIEEITVRANDAVSHWSVTKKILNDINGQFFEVLNTLV